MAAIVVTVYPTEAYKAGRKMVIMAEDGTLKWTVNWAPQSVSFDGLARASEIVPRPMRTPLLQQGAGQLKTMAFEVTVGYKNMDSTCEGTLATINNLSRTTKRLKITGYGAHEGGLWRMTSLSYSSIQRHKHSQLITRATVSLEFTRVSDLIRSVGPISGGVSTSAATTTTPAKRYHTVKSGDTLTKISVKYYGNTRGVSKIMNANGLRNANNISVGRKLVIP